MSKFFEEIGWSITILFFCAILGAGNYFWDLSWNFLKTAKKQETWVTAKRIKGSYSPLLDEKWAHSTIYNMDVKAKLRDAITDDKNDKIDFAYEVKAKLTRPAIAENVQAKELDYRIDIDFKLIDVDGFVVDSISQGWYTTMYHEKHKTTLLKHEWNDPESEEVTIKVLYRDAVNANVAKRVKKIGYEAKIEVTRKYDGKKVKEASQYDENQYEDVYDENQYEEAP